MAIPDLINGCYEALGSLFILMSILRLHKDKKVRGVSIIGVAFFMSWGYWNLYYYPSLNQWWSFIGGLFIVISNTFWVGQMIYYSVLEKASEEKTQQLSWNEATDEYMRL